MYFLVKTKDFFLRQTFYIVASAWIFLQEEEAKNNGVWIKLSYLYPTKPALFLFHCILEHLSFHRCLRTHFLPLNFWSQNQQWCSLCFQQHITSILGLCFGESAFVWTVSCLLSAQRLLMSESCPAGIKMSVFAEYIKHYDILPSDPLCPLNHLTHPIWCLRALKIHYDILYLGTLLIYSMLSAHPDKIGKCLTPEPLLII